jgi:hypothetical protein
VQTHLLRYQIKQAFDLAICTMVLTFWPDRQIADAIEKLPVHDWYDRTENIE